MRHVGKYERSLESAFYLKIEIQKGYCVPFRASETTIFDLYGWATRINMGQNKIKAQGPYL
jgi:hypothetical protein